MLKKVERFYIRAILMILIPLGIIGVILGCVLLTVAADKEVMPFIIVFDVLIGLALPLVLYETVYVFKYLIKEF